MEVCDSFYAATAFGGLVITAVAFIAKSIVKTLLERDVLAYRARLDERTTNALDTYRSSLETERIRLQISYGGIFERQAEAILELYRLLTRLERQMNLAAHVSEEGTEHSAFVEAWRHLFEYYLENKILLTAEIDKRFDHIINTMLRVVQDIRHVDQRMQRSGHIMSDEQANRLFQRQDNAYEILNQIPQVKSELTAELRKLIGIHHSELP